MQPSIRSKKALGVALSQLKVFDTPDARLEQYSTPSHVAAEMLWQAHIAGDLDDKTILDLGAGTGILGIGALLLGAKHVIFIEKDDAAIATLQENLRLVEAHTPILDRVRIIPEDVMHTAERAETVIMNPPFGTRETHADINFLAYALTHARAVYSFHKTATVAFLRKKIVELGGIIQSEQPFTYPLVQSMKQHEKPVERIAVTLFVITREE